MVDGLDAVLATAARQMDDADSSEELLEVAVGWAVHLVPGCDRAGVTLRRRRGRLESVAPSDPVVAACDELQHALGEGPCVDAVTEDPVIIAADVGSDARWPRWGPRAAGEHGVASMLGVRLFSSDRVHGALNIYGRSTDAFDQYAIDVAVLLGTHVSVALRSALADENLRVALDSRHRIGQAQGILMERYGLEVGRAFELLSRVSQEQNIRLVDVADHVVGRRELPGARDAVAI